MPPLRSGEVITRREVLHGATWLEHPVTVVADNGDVLAVRLDPGSRFTFFPEHPFGPHPWRAHEAWGGSVVLMLTRVGSPYGVWKYFDLDGTFRHWYVNFEPRPLRHSDAYDTGDHGLDLLIHTDGRREWKDVEDLHHQRVEGRLTPDDVTEVLAAAAGLVDLLDQDRRWWAPWDDWTL